MNSGPYAEFGNNGLSATKDPTIPQKTSRPSHPSRTDASHSYQSMYGVPYASANVFVNPFLGYQMWDYEDGWGIDVAQEARNPTDAEPPRASSTILKRLLLAGYGLIVPSLPKSGN